MANTFNLNTNDSLITFNLGDFSLEFNPSDDKSKAIFDKANEVKLAAENLTEGDEWENRKSIKELLDDFLATFFDSEAPEKVYNAAGQNTWNYLKVFLQISEAILEVRKKQENDETFKKYLAE